MDRKGPVSQGEARRLAHYGVQEGQVPETDPVQAELDKAFSAMQSGTEGKVTFIDIGAGEDDECGCEDPRPGAPSLVVGDTQSSPGDTPQSSQSSDTPLPPNV